MDCIGNICLFYNLAPNLIIILFLLIYLSKRDLVPGGIIATFVYASLHFIYAIFLTANSDDPTKILNGLHENQDFSYSLTWFLFLVFISVLILKRLKEVNANIRMHSIFMINFSLLLVLFLLVITVNVMNSYDGVNISKLIAIEKEVLYSASMWCGAVFFALALNSISQNCRSHQVDIVVFSGMLLTVMVITGLYEITTGAVWAFTKDSLRASSTLFNPNVLGVWCSLMIVLIAFMFHKNWISRVLLFVYVLLLTITLVLSGSRTGFLLTFTNLISVTFLLIINKKVSQITTLNILMPMLGLIVSFLFVLVTLNIFQSNFYLLKTLLANINRFIYLPLDLWAVIFNSAAMISSDTMLSINGRVITGEFSDNSFLSIFSIGGISATILWLLIWVLILFIAIKKIRVLPCPYSIYSLVTILGCLISGLFLRSAQTFPTFVLIAVFLGLSLWWLLFGNKKS